MTDCGLYISKKRKKCIETLTYKTAFKAYKYRFLNLQDVPECTMKPAPVSVTQRAGHTDCWHSFYTVTYMVQYLLTLWWNASLSFTHQTGCLPSLSLAFMTQCWIIQVKI